MSQGPFDVATFPARDHTLLCARGEIDIATVAQFAAAISCVADGVPLIVDMADVTFMDSTGLAVLIRAKQQGVSVRVRCPSINVRRLIEIARLTALIDDGMSGALQG